MPINTKKRIWPENFPEDCPPSNARKDSVLVFRYVKNNPPKRTDFCSHKELQKGYDKSFECQACGISVYTSLQDVVTLGKKIPAIGKMSLAKGQINNESGVISNTPSNGNSHITWWIYPVVDPSTFFECV